MMARANMRIGPMTQFCTSESPRIFLFRKTSPSSSYFTLASGGYIIRIRPIAIGTLVVPTWKLLMKASVPWMKYPSPTPRAIAAKIQSVKYLSMKESLLACVLFINIPLA